MCVCIFSYLHRIKKRENRIKSTETSSCLTTEPNRKLNCDLCEPLNLFKPPIYHEYAKGGHHATDFVCFWSAKKSIYETKVAHTHTQ